MLVLSPSVAWGVVGCLAGTLVEIAVGVRWSNVVPRVSAALAQGNDVVYSSSPQTRESQILVNLGRAEVTNPVILFKEGQVVNLVSLRINSPALR